MIENSKPGHRIGIDLGGSKISAVRLDAGGTGVKYLRQTTPHNDYLATCQAITDLVRELDHIDRDALATVGVGVPGSRSPLNGRIRNANSFCLNGNDLKADLEQALSRPVRIANDADCFAISEATDGVGKDAHMVWGIILGTGCGSGLVLGQRLHSGPLAIAGEWGHNPLPWPTEEETHQAAHCWCGRTGCIETWLSGPGLVNDHRRATGINATAPEIHRQAGQGDKAAQDTLDRHTSRLGRAMAQVINIIDPDVIVMGGGVSQMPNLTQRLPAAITPYIFSDHVALDIRLPCWGDDSGVRGAACLWP